MWQTLLYNEKCSINRAIMEPFLAFYGAIKGLMYKKARSFVLFWFNFQLQKQHIKPVHVPVSNKDFRRVGILRCLLAVNVEKHGMISGNVKKHLTTIHGWLNLGWHELFLGVSLFFHISSPFSHIFNQKSFNLCIYLVVATFYQERMIDW